jgi:hypothetical protein
MRTTLQWLHRVYLFHLFFFCKIHKMCNFYSEIQPDRGVPLWDSAFGKICVAHVCALLYVQWMGNYWLVSKSFLNSTLDLVQNVRQHFHKWALYFQISLISFWFVDGNLCLLYLENCWKQFSATVVWFCADVSKSVSFRTACHTSSLIVGTN